MKKIYRPLVWVIVSIIAVAGFIPAAAHDNNANQYIKKIIGCNLQKASADSVQEWIDGELTANAGIGSEWYIISLSNYGNFDFSDYKNALNKYLTENEVGSASTRLKYALTLIAVGEKTNPYISEAAENSIGKQGIMSLVFGLHLLNNGCSCDTYPVNGLIDELLSLQLADGGFSIMGEFGDVDVTAMTVQALAVHYNSIPDVKTAVDNAINFLSSCQLEDGGYSAYGVENPESSAQVVIALSSLKIDPCSDDRFIKNGNTIFDGISSFLMSDGSFCHKVGGSSDSTATAQVFSASIAYLNMKDGRQPFYIFNENGIAPEETHTESSSTEITLSEAHVSEEKTNFIETTANTASTTTINKTETSQKAEIRKAKTDSFRLIIISICIVSLMICAVLFVIKKRKFIVFIVMATVAAIILFVKVADTVYEDTAGIVTISISCEVIKNEDKSYIPENGVILKKTDVKIYHNETVYDVFSRVCKDNKIPFSANMGYIEGINNIYEKDFGNNSGWIYFVNGEAPSVGCGSCKVKDGDCIEWHYTLETGRDLDIDFEK